MSILNEIEKLLSDENKTFTGKNPDFTAVWDASKQSYSVYKNGKLITVKYNFSDIESYLN